MKKLISLLSFMLLASLLLVSPTAAAQSEPGYVAYVDSSGIKLVSPGGATMTVVDGVYRLTSGANRPSIEVKDLTYENVRVKEYPIVAIKIKLHNVDSVFGGFDFATDNSLYIKNTLGASIGSYPMKSLAVYERTTDWQLLYADMSSFYSKYTTVGGVDYYWIEDDTKYAFNLIHPMQALISGETYTFDLAWVGYFKTVEDAQAYFDSSTGDSETTANTTTVTTATTTAAQTTNQQDTTRATTSTADTTNASSDQDKNTSSSFTTVLIWVIVIAAAGAVAVFVVLKVKKQKSE